MNQNVFVDFYLCYIFYLLFYTFLSLIFLVFILFLFILFFPTCPFLSPLPLFLFCLYFSFSFQFILLFIPLFVLIPFFSLLFIYFYSITLLPFFFLSLLYSTLFFLFTLSFTLTLIQCYFPQNIRNLTPHPPNHHVSFVHRNFNSLPSVFLILRHLINFPSKLPLYLSGLLQVNLTPSTRHLTLHKVFHISQKHHLHLPLDTRTLPTPPFLSARNYCSIYQ